MVDSEKRGSANGYKKNTPCMHPLGGCWFIKWCHCMFVFVSVELMQIHSKGDFIRKRSFRGLIIVSCGDSTVNKMHLDAAAVGIVCFCY